VPGRAAKLVLATVAALSATAAAIPAQAAIPPTLIASCAQKDAADADTATLELPFFLCDDGTPEAGGRDPNPTGDKAVTVPAAYDGHQGLPPKSPDANTIPGADATGDIALDVDLSFPDPARHPPPPGGYPLVVMMHGCCSGTKTGWEAQTVDEPGSAEKWHYSNAWFASRGYVVLTYTSRGFAGGKGPGDPNGDGSTGETQIDHRAFEINDYQSLAAQLVDGGPFTVGGQPVTVDPSRILTTGGSYGGGFSWLTLTDPVWQSPGGRRLELKATAPRYGWTDLAYSLVPNGRHRERELPATDGSDSLAPIGFPKRSAVGALFATGQLGATFPLTIAEAFACLEGPLPFDANPQCAGTVDQIVPGFIRDRSAYYQDDFFTKIANGQLDPVPVFSAGTLTDPLFPGIEHRRMVARLKKARPGYPVKEYYGDYQHFVQNKRKEWADVCGADTCALADYAGGDVDEAPAGLSRTGITTRLNRFVDHYLKPQANPAQSKPANDVTAALQVCPSNASDASPLDSPGETFTADTFEQLAPNTLEVRRTAQQSTTSVAAPNPHAINADPVVQQATRSGTCPTETQPAGPGVATYDSPALERDYTMIGPTRVTVPFTGSAADLQLNARLYDVAPDGSQTMVDRGFLTLANAGGNPDTSPAVFDLLGNAWRFPAGHTVRIELAQDDDPYLRRSTVPSSLTLQGVTLEVPVRETSAQVGDAPPPPPASPPQGGAAPGGGGGGGGGGGQEPDARDRDTQADESGGSLPFTGLAIGALVLLGAALAVAGVALRRRASAN
jgi:dienelactone hydrolase